MTEPSLPDRLRGDLVTALKDRDRPRVAALRQALAAIANAEAPPQPQRRLRVVPSPPDVGRLHEADRLELSPADVLRILRAEVAEHEAAADEYERIGRPREAADRIAEAGALRRYLA